MDLADDMSPERVDYYVEKIREAYYATNKLFMSFLFFQWLLIIGYYLFIGDKIEEFSFYGIKTTDHEMTKTWFLVLPSFFFLLNCYVGYLRVYQKEAIEWLLCAFRNSEYKSELYRLTFPPNHILGMELLQRQSSKVVKALVFIPNILIAIFSIIIPPTLIIYGYTGQFESLTANYGLTISFSLSLFLLTVGFIVILLSQKI
jgi:hypothetical protein